MARLCAPVGELHPSQAPQNKPLPGLDGSLTRVVGAQQAELETSEIVSPVAALLRNAPPPSRSKTPADTASIYFEAQTRTPSYLSQPRQPSRLRLCNCPVSRLRRQ